MRQLLRSARGARHMRNGPLHRLRHAATVPRGHLERLRDLHLGLTGTEDAVETGKLRGVAVVQLSPAHPSGADLSGRPRPCS